jgi:hypothetical protein
LGAPVVPEVITQNAGSSGARETGISGTAALRFHAASSRSR